ncbi:MAG TPA: Gfo/Idh/MocA family oxidoreductase, partial [Vicinamibacteria bacterium]
MGMVGGGRGAFIGAVHRMAAALDGRIELSCGAFSSDRERSLDSGRDLLLPEDRIYGSYREMFEKERALPASERMDFVAIVTPNDEHYPPARMALEAGFPVMCDKPLCLDLAEARELRALVKSTGLLFGLTHNYSGYPMVKEARGRVRSGELGRIRRVVAEYPQGWLASPLERTGQKQASWRTDRARAGASCCLGDIGTHAAHLTEYVTGLPIEEVACELTTFVPGRTLDDDGSLLLRLSEGARGVLWASQVAIGEENGLNLRVYGEKGSLEWRQEEPNSLVLKRPDRPREILRSGVNHGLADSA